MPTPHRHPDSQPLLERDEALGRVADALASAARGAGQTVIVSGPPGIGKTRVLAASAELAGDAGLRPLRARGSEAEQGFPFAGALQLLETTVAGLGDASGSILSGSAALARPVLAGAYLSGAGGPLASAVHGLFWLTVNLAQREPLVLLLDDLQSLDDPTLAYLLYLHRRIADLPVALVASCRPLDALARPALSELVFDPEVAELPLEPLTGRGVAALVRTEFAHDASGEFCEACARVSGGNPFYVKEVLEALRLEGAGAGDDDARRLADVEPQAIARAVLLRLARLDPGARSLARACAILGPDAPVTLAARVAELDIPEALRAADVLASALILERGQPLQIAHALIATALTGDLPAGERAALHRRAADGLSAEHAPDERIAAHLVHALPGAAEQHVEVLARAAQHALDAGMPETAIAYLRRALLEPPATPERRIELLLALGGAEVGTDPDAARAHLEQARSLGAEEHGTAQLALALGRALYVAGEHDRAAQTFLDAADRLPLDDPVGRELQAWFASASIFVEELRGRAREMVERLVVDPPVRPTTTERTVLARAALEQITLGGPLYEVEEIAQAAWGGGALLREETCDGYSWMHITAIHLWGGNYAEAERVANDVLDDARRRGSVMAFATASYIKGSAELFQGRLLESLADVGQALEVHHRDGWRMFIGATRYVEVEALIERGLVAEAAVAATALDPEDYSSSGEGAMLRYVQGRVALAQGRPDDAVAHLLAARDQAQRLALAPVRLLPVWLPLAEAHARRGEVELAANELVAGEAAARRADVPDMVAAILVARAQLQQGDGALELLREAVALAERSQSKLAVARAQAALGARLRRAGKRSAAEAPLRAALDLAHRLGAAPLEALARDELAVLGKRPRRAPASGVESLTASELRIARLAAEGLTNRAIAEALFVTPKTVEYHLRNVFMKLDVRARGDLPRALDEGLPVHSGPHHAEPAPGVAR